MQKSSYGPLARLLQWGVAVFLAIAAPVMAAPVQATPMKIVVVGDSLSAGYLLPEPDSFPAQLERALKAKGHDVAVVNAGVSGDTASDGVERIDWSVPEDADLVVLELGANDMLRGLDPAVTRDALTKILARLAERHIKTLLCGMKAAPNMGEDYATKFAAIYPELAAQFNVPLYGFFLDGMAREPKFTLADGMHPNASGVGVIVERILPSIEALLAQH